MSTRKDIFQKTFFFVCFHFLALWKKIKTKVKGDIIIDYCFGRKFKGHVDTFSLVTWNLWLLPFYTFLSALELKNSSGFLASFSAEVTTSAPYYISTVGLRLTLSSVVTICKMAWNNIMAPGWKAVRAQPVVYGGAAPLRSHKGWRKTKRWNVGGWAMNSERPRPSPNLKRVMLFFLFLFISLGFAMMWYSLQLHDGRNARPLWYSTNLWSGDGQGDGLHTRTTFWFFFFFSVFEQIWCGSENTNVKHFHDWGPSGLSWGSFPSCQLCLYLSDFLIQTTRTITCCPLVVFKAAGSNKYAAEEIGWFRLLIVHSCVLMTGFFFFFRLFVFQNKSDISKLFHFYWIVCRDLEGMHSTFLH